MIDTAIVFIGFACAALISFVCAIEYGCIGQRSSMVNSMRKCLPSIARAHTLILMLVFVCVIVSFMIPREYNERVSLAEQTVQLIELPETTALSE